MKSFKVLVAGGGAGGCSVAAKFASLPKGAVGIIDPAETHYYQPMWTLVGGGMKSLKDSSKPMSQVLPKNAVWIKDSVASFEPRENVVSLRNGEKVQYEYLVVALGMKLEYNKIEGLPEAFETPGVCSNYSANYVDKTFRSLKDFKGGNAIFTFPNTLIKCPGAPQKIMYIADEYMRKHGVRNNAEIFYNSSLGVIFAVKKYADALWKVVEERNINVNLRHELIEVKPDSKEAVFRLLEKPEETRTFQYSMLHITPPMGPPDAVKNSSELCEETGYLDLNKFTLQHKRFPNVFGIGDCTNLPIPKTAAAVAAQGNVLYQNMKSVMENSESKERYDGYTSCPLVTGYSKCILAEFDYDLSPLETFPLNQARESRTAFHLKKDVLPTLYWELFLR
ncbi:sulfide:quinone oxidoreductase, mitochondrial-like [Artemia franciscana]|uniref:sulfide:quinone oxidoreductase, mitochondrial-like n=1 Tax=Artemia franciscana TaxID=6661 RepID=UPI0032DAC7A9